MYFLFAWDTYYPSGGLNDYEGAYDSLEKAEEAGKKLKDKDRVQIAAVRGIHLIEISSFRPGDYQDEEDQENA